MHYFDLRFQLKRAVTDSEAMDFGEKGFFFDAADRVPYVTADVSGDTAAGEALYEAHRRLCAEGLEIERAVPNLVAVSSMAHRFGVSRQAAQRWSKAETFPLPIITDGTSLWYWPEVRSWVRSERGKSSFDDCLYPSLDDYTLFNATLLGAGASAA